jgi:hypothetical protein
LNWWNQVPVLNLIRRPTEEPGHTDVYIAAVDIPVLAKHDPRNIEQPGSWLFRGLA